MNCPKCLRLIPDDAVLCCYCGKKLKADERKAARRPNGTGNVYKRGQTWTARVVDHYEHKEGKLRPVWKTKGGFKSKKAAINYLPKLMETARVEHKPLLFIEDYNRWRESYASRVSASTMAGYASAFKHLSPLHYRRIDQISAVDLQGVIDKSEARHRTKQMMKITAGLVFTYAINDDQITRNPAATIYVGESDTQHYEPLTEEELSKIEASGLEYSDYVVALCYLGHRPSEFFSFKKSDYHKDGNIHYITGGVKTEAGKTRAVTIPPHILPIIEKRLAVEETEYLFPRYDKNRKGQPVGLSKMPEQYFREFVFKPMMDKLGIVGKTVYAARHTYANKIKRASGDEKDKAGLMGHTSYDVTREYYQTTTLTEKAAITDQL